VTKITNIFSYFFKENEQPEIYSKEKLEASKALYEYFQKQVEHEKNRFQKFEDKASKFLTMISVIITAYLFITNNFSEQLVGLCTLSPVLQFYQVVLIGLLILLFISLSLSWLYLLKTLKLQITRHLPTTKETIEVYVKYPNRLDEIYEDNAQRMQEVVSEYRSSNKVKARIIAKAYQYIFISGILFVIVVPLSISYKYLI